MELLVPLQRWIIRSRSHILYPYPDSLGPRFNLNDFPVWLSMTSPLALVRTTFSISPSNYFIGRSCRLSTLPSTTPIPILLISTYYELESKRIWFRLKSEEYIMIDTVNVNEAWAAAYNLFGFSTMIDALGMWLISSISYWLKNLGFQKFVSGKLSAISSTHSQNKK
jgi:hypothetical protein